MNVRFLTRPLLLALATSAAMLVWSASPTAAPEIPVDAASVRHALTRLTFGPRPGDVERVQQMGLERWLNDQLAPSVSDNPALRTRLAALETLNLDSARIARDYIIPAREARRARQQAAQPGASSNPPPQADMPPEMRRPPAGPATGQRQVIEELATAKLLRAVYSDRQIEEVLVDFWFNHFNVFAAKGREPMFITSYDRDTIRPRVLGRFRDLLGATAQSPAMLFYLDNWLSTSPDASQALARMRARRPPGAQAAPNALRSAGRDAAGIPRRFVETVRQSIMSVLPRFTTRRMVKEYARRMYVPALGGAQPGK